jgi:uncharacterized protein
MFEQPVDGLAGVIEPAPFARAGNRLSGHLEAARLPRVSELLFDGAGSVRYEVRGFVDHRGYNALRVELQGELTLRCQRCLGPMVQPVQVRRDIVLVPGADEFAQREDETELEDVIPDVQRLDLGPLLEEELLLALPLAPRHGEGECTAAVEVEQVPAPSPFAALAKLKQ